MPSSNEHCPVAHLHRKSKNTSVSHAGVFGSRQLLAAPCHPETSGSRPCNCLDKALPGRQRPWRLGRIQTGLLSKDPVSPSSQSLSASIEYRHGLQPAPPTTVEYCPPNPSWREIR